MPSTQHPHDPSQKNAKRQNAEQRNDAPQIKVDDIRLGDNIPSELYAGIAEAKAKFISDNSKNINKITQLRRFYDDLCLWNEKINGQDTLEKRAERYRELEPLVKMLHAKVFYAKGRGYVDDNFVKLLRHLLKEIKDAKTLEQAKLFMEAFMGFYKAYNG